MPGKKESASAYSYMSSVKLYRTITAIDVATQAAIGAIAEVIPLGTDDSDSANEGISVGRDNGLTLGVLLPTGVASATIRTYVNMKGALGVSNGWAFVQENVVTVSTHIAIRQVYPGDVKVIMSAITGAGSVESVYSRSS